MADKTINDDEALFSETSHSTEGREGGRGEGGTGIVKLGRISSRDTTEQPSRQNNVPANRQKQYTEHLFQSY